MILLHFNLIENLNAAEKSEKIEQWMRRKEKWKMRKQRIIIEVLSYLSSNSLNSFNFQFFLKKKIK